MLSSRRVHRHQDRLGLEMLYAFTLWSLLRRLDAQMCSYKPIPVVGFGFGKGNTLTRYAEPRQNTGDFLAEPASRPVGHGLPPFEELTSR
jgi:hypothetical protein